MRGEVLGAERRRRWTAEQKARIVAESFGSGEPVSWVARRHELSTSQLFAWRKAARDGTDAGLAAVAAAFLPVEVSADDEDEVGTSGVRSAYTPPVLPPLPSRPDPAGSVVPFRRLVDEEGPGPAGPGHPAQPSGPGGGDDDAAGRIEAILPDGVVLRLPGDVAPDRLAELVGALRGARP
jgi:transposase